MSAHRGARYIDVGSTRRWIAGRYLPMAWASLGVSVVLHLFIGGRPEAMVDLWFLALNITATLMHRTRPTAMVLLHIGALGLMIFWYCSVDTSVPSVLGQPALVFSALAAFPNLVLASLYGVGWGATSTSLGVAAVVVLAPDSGQLITGTFLLAVSGLLGAGFYHRLLTMLADVQRRLADAAYQDPMTGLGNRRAFAADFARRASPGIEVAVWDVDRLKEVNDEFGHGAGDAYLLAFVDALSAATSGETGSYRIGGDEFVTFHPGGSDVASVVSRVRERFPWVSVGAVSSVGRSLNQVLADADRLLYEDKADRTRSVRTARSDDPEAPGRPGIDASRR